MQMKLVPKYRMNVPREDWRQPFFYIAEAWIIQYFIQLCIVLNTGILMMQWQGMDSTISGTFD